MRKKLFAILMSAMMMVTFMPAMAFAAPAAPVWADKCAKVTYCDVEYNVTRVWNSAGFITATSEPIARNVSKEGLKDTEWHWVNSSNKNLGWVLEKSFYDLDGAYVATPVSTDFSTWARRVAIENSEKTPYLNTTATQAQASLLLVKPSYVSSSSDGNTYAQVAYNGISGYEFYLDTVAYDTTKLYENQTFTMAVTKKVVAGYNEALATTYGTVAPKTLTIKAAVATPTDMVAGQNEALYYGFDGKAGLSVNYDGAAHTFGQLAVPGITSTYKVYNEKTGAWDTATEIQMKDVDTLRVKVLPRKTGLETDEGNINISVAEATPFTFEFKKNDAVPQGVDANTFDVEAGFNAKDFVEIVPGTPAVSYTGDALVAKKAADKKAIEANKALLDEYFNDFFTVTTKAKEYDATQVTATIEAKDLSKLTVAEKDALVAKYSTLLANFGQSISRSTFEGTAYAFKGIINQIAQFNISAGDIDWVKAPLTKKYYNKKGTLKKTYTFAVEAKANAKVTYKLTNGGEMIKIDKNTGKVTVKKGLKVGTYKVAITATAGKATDTYTMTIQMAKKK